MLLTAEMAFSHFHRWSLVSFLTSHCGQALVPYITHFLFRVFMVRSVLVMDFTKYVLSAEVFNELKPLLIFSSEWRMRLVVCQSTLKALAIFMIRSDVWCVTQLA